MSNSPSTPEARMKKKSFLHTVDLFIRSFIYFFFIIIATIIQSFICIIFCLFPLRFRYYLITNYVAFMIWGAKTICRINYKVEGLENILKDRNGIILSKHQSTWETFFLPTIFYQPAIILKRELLWLPFFGWGLATIDPIAINRGDRSSAMEQIINKGRRCLENHRWVLVFPEGTRIAPGKVGKYRLGGARLAVATGYPVIPVAHNAGYLWSKRKFIKQPGTVNIVVGPMIETKGRAAEDVLEEAKNWIEQTVTRIGVPETL